MNSAVVRAEDLKFSEDSVKDVLKNLIIPLWNAYSFFVTYANIDGYEPSETPYEKLSNPMDTWIISSSEKLIEEVTLAFDAYDIQKACALFVPFIDDLNNWYIRRSRRRFWRSENDGDKKEAYDTLYRVLMTFIHIAAPIIPFTTEEMYQNLKTEDMSQSIHLALYPEYQSGQRDVELEKKMALTQKAIVMGRSLRASNNLKTRQPLKTLFLVDRTEEEREVLFSMRDIIAEELNVKEVLIQEDESGLVSYSAKANFKVLGSKLGKHMKSVASQIELFSGDTIASILDGGSRVLQYSEGEIEISSEQIIVQRTEKEGVKVLNEGSLTVGFDTTVTEELLQEGIARDIVRSVQNLRKDSGFDVSDRIRLTYDGDEVVQRVFENFGTSIAQETLSNSITFATLENVEATECGDHLVRLAVAKD
jgi:isoleucyl-tRNA synthetase